MTKKLKNATQFVVYLSEGNDVSNVYADETWLETWQQEHACHQCREPRDLHKLDARVKNPVPCAIAPIWISGLGYGNDEFLSMIGLNDLRKSAAFGQLFDRDGVPVAGYSTYYVLPNAVALRGNRESAFRICPGCQQAYYQPSGNAYIVRDELPDTCVSFTSFGTIILSREYFETLNLGPWKKYLKISKIRIVDEPKDGKPRRRDGVWLV